MSIMYGREWGWGNEDIKGWDGGMWSKKWRCKNKKWMNCDMKKQLVVPPNLISCIAYRWLKTI